MKPIDSPTYLYKYFSFNKYAKEALEKRCIFLVDHRSFNDHFDCQVGHGLELVVRESVKRNVENEFANLPYFRVAALSEVRDNILIWALYSNDHKGFVSNSNWTTMPY